MRDKMAVREGVWAPLERSGAVGTKNVHDKIPDFQGAETAAQHLFELEIWRKARVVKSNPDRPQRPIRRRALEEGKVLYMAVPRLRTRQCFIQLDPAVLGTSPGRASTIAGAFQHGRLVSLEEMPPVDLVVSGSVAVNRRGTRVGKGGGFADLEYALAATAGIIRRDTPVITTVHRSQVLEEELPSTLHDVCLDYVITPEETIRCTGNSPRPEGIYWEELEEAKIAQIPVLQKLRSEQGPAHAAI